MPSPVNPRPTPSTLAGRRVGVAVSSAHGRRWAQELNYLRAHAVQCIGEAHYPIPRTSSPTYDANLLYQRTPGVMALRVCVKLHHGDTGSSSGGHVRIAVGTDPNALTTLPDPSPTPIAAFIGVEPPVFTSSSFLSLPNERLREHEEHIAFIDVSEFDPASVYVIRLRYTSDGTATDGPWSFSLHEVALATVDPVADPTAEPGFNEAEPDSRNRLRQGVSGVNGVLRLWSELDVARSQVRRHIAVSRSGTRADASYGALVWGAELVVSDPVFLARARRLYDPAVAGNSAKLWVLYAFNATYAGLSDAKIKITFDTTAVGGATTASYEFQLTDTGSNLAVGSVDVTLPCDGTDQLVEFTISAKTQSDNGGGGTSVDTLTVLALALIEDET